jgi:cytochrome oxidase Cu insertion factor (SCO1/SenC/PrrC family)
MASVKGSRRWIGFGVAVAAVVAGGWLAGGLRTSAPPKADGRAQVAAGSLDDLLMDLQLVPLDGQAPRPFALETLDGRRMALADFAGKPALLYFWATW